MVMHTVHNHAMSDRLRRWRLLREIIRRGSPSSQERLADLLRREGVEVTQATLSRDLRELGVLKGPTGYVLPDAPAAHDARPQPAALAPPPATMVELGSALRAYLRRIDAGGNIVVLHTGPGQASLLAAELDRIPIRTVMGTVAGDDTIFVATRSPRAATSLHTQLRQIAGLKA